jgi:hypothetical protein
LSGQDGDLKVVFPDEVDTAGEPDKTTPDTT